jgi:ribosome-associated protein
MIRLTPTISIDESEIQEEFIRASGAGGQNVNKVSSAVQLRCDAKHSPSLPDDVRRRLIRLAGKRITEDGVLLINARRFRTQSRNRADALERLAAWVRKAEPQPARRRRTRPPAAAKRKRLDAKRRQGETKRRRGQVPASDEENL